ncbi:hypothetical protein [Zavarzinella formosa]|uniref:hypothetical protein n=1 Tax=Zavarzinella formosa TaxID=360055 RepID=UPI0003668CF7|nr:hypothetical protein [Zavarzinella formosa]
MSANITPQFKADTHSKALAINLDADIYGTIAEIGAGQEVARWFLKVGAASGTVAKTISAYDKTVSDAIYGAGTRYVSKERLLKMLDYEFKKLTGRLEPSCGDVKKFFVFGDTASARNYAGDNEQHAWVGLRFLSEPHGEPNEIILHVALIDRTNERQQEALGILGVNLIHAVHHHRNSMEELLAAIWDDLSLSRLEVDTLEFSGPAMACFDARRCALYMLRHGMSKVMTFDATGNLIDPSSVLRKRPMILERGRFATLEPFHGKMLDAAEHHLCAEGIPLGREPVRVLEMTLNPVGGDGPSDDEVLERIGLLSGLGVVLVSSLPQGYLLVDHLRRFSSEPVRFTMGISLLARVLDDEFYPKLPGRLLEGLGKLFAANVKIYVYPMPREEILASLESRAEHFDIVASENGDVEADGLNPKPPINHLYRYLREANWVVPVTFETPKTAQ